MEINGIQIHCKFDELVNIRDIPDYSKNPNKHGDDQIARLAKLYEHQGVRHPIIVCVDRKVIAAGHGRKLGGIRAGMEKFPVVYQKFESDEQFYAFVASDNAIASWADLDMSSINAELENLGPDFDLDWLGLKNFSLDPSETKNTGAEVDLESFNNFQHQCPKCGFEWDEKNEPT